MMRTDNRSKKHRLTPDQSGRLDKVLSEALGMSRNQIEKLIKQGAVTVNGKEISKPSYKVTLDDTISYTFIEATPQERKPVDFDVEVLYEDEHLMVVNKPAGLVVHPAPSVKESTLVDWLAARGVSLSTISGEERHGIVHRIDKETTGTLVIAKTNEAHERLALQLQDKSMGRYYLALIDIPLKSDTIIDAPIARHPKNRLKMGVVQGGKEAKTAFVKLAQSTLNTELIAAKLFTGRTHQIRVHLGTLSRHILGDRLYGFKSKTSTIPRVYLHAYRLYLTHPVSNRPLAITAPLFADMQHYLDNYFDAETLRNAIRPEIIKQRLNDLVAP